MTSPWYSVPYPGGIVAVPGFPRELHVGDPDGADVLAWKRFAWRMGRWPGPASAFDDSYSDGFANGRGPNVIDTGIAGVQRQLGYPDTGVITEAFFDDCRSRRIPDALPNAGQFGFDANAANLLAEAYARFAAPPPPPPRTSTTRELALKGATSWLGYKESPAGSNNTKFGSWYGANYQPYCAMFVSYCFEVEAGGSPSFEKGVLYAYVPYMVGDARNGRNGLNITDSPIPGDLCMFDWQRDSTWDHVGFVDNPPDAAGNFVSVEGNTSSDNDPSGSQSNGGGVYRRHRNANAQGTVFVRVQEP